jgi:uncharacterized membrane protein (DUF2068 family)
MRQLLNPQVPNDLNMTSPSSSGAHLDESHVTELLTPSVVGKSRGALLTIAVFEAVKGLAAIAASLGLLSLAHKDVRRIAYALIGHFRLDPEAHYPQLLIETANWIATSNVYAIFAVAVLYAVIRLVEAYGLWKDRAWAEWLAALSGSLYLPLELNHLIAHTTTINACVLIGNLAVVVFMVFRLKKRRHEAEFDSTAL